MATEDKRKEAGDKGSNLAEFKWPLRQQLRNPVPGKAGDDVNVLEFREPNTADLIKSGYADGEATAERIADLMATLAEVPKASVRMLHPADYFAVQRKLADFFQVSAGIS